MTRNAIDILLFWVLLTLFSGTLLGCSIKKLALTGVANSLSSGSSDVFSTDDDPELVRDAIPFALKTIESLLAELPEHEGLLLSACKGFTQYSFAFVQTDAELLADTDYREATRLRERALRLYLRARDYGLRGLESRHEGVSESLRVDPEAAVRAIGPDEVPMLYWTGAAWGAAISLGKDRPDLFADLPAITAIMKRALQLNESYDRGSIHEVMVTLESLSANMGGSLERARNHYQRALVLSGGQRAGTYVTLAENVSIQTQNRGEFERLLRRALTIDPDAVPTMRLQNLIVQKRARHLLSNTDDFFIDFEAFDEPEDEGETR